MELLNDFRNLDSIVEIGYKNLLAQEEYDLRHNELLEDDLKGFFTNLMIKERALKKCEDSTKDSNSQFPQNVQRQRPPQAPSIQKPQLSNSRDTGSENFKRDLLRSRIQEKLRNKLGDKFDPILNETKKEMKTDSDSIIAKTAEKIKRLKQTIFYSSQNGNPDASHFAAIDELKVEIQKLKEALKVEINDKEEVQLHQGKENVPTKDQEIVELPISNYKKVKNRIETRSKFVKAGSPECIQLSSSDDEKTNICENKIESNKITQMWDEIKKNYLPPSATSSQSNNSNVDSEDTKEEIKDIENVETEEKMEIENNEDFKIAHSTKLIKDEISQDGMINVIEDDAKMEDNIKKCKLDQKFEGFKGAKQNDESEESEDEMVFDIGDEETLEDTEDEEIENKKVDGMKQDLKKSELKKYTKIDENKKEKTPIIHRMKPTTLNKKVKRWLPSVRYRVEISSSDESGSEIAEVEVKNKDEEKPKRKAAPRIVRPKTKRYSVAEDIKILKIIGSSKWHSHIKGYTIYKIMSEQVFMDRTCMSLGHRFMKFIYLNLKSYGLSEKEINLYREGEKAKNRGRANMPKTPLNPNFERYHLS